MIPVQMIRVGLGDEAIHVPVFRLAFVGGRDSFASPGGFFVTPGGEYGVVVDARLSFADAQAAATEEIRKNLPRLSSLVAQHFDKLQKEHARSTVS